MLRRFGFGRFAARLKRGETVRDVVAQQRNRQDSLSVRDVVIPPSLSVAGTLEKLTDVRSSGALLVKLPGHKISGIVTQHDALRWMIGAPSGAEHCVDVSRIMSKAVVYVPADTPKAECIHVMKERGIQHLPVLDDQKLCGLVSLFDLVSDLGDVSESQTRDPPRESAARERRLVTKWTYGS